MLYKGHRCCTVTAVGMLYDVGGGLASTPGLVTIFALAHLPAALLFGVAPKAVDLGAAVAADVAIGVAEDELAD